MRARASSARPGSSAESVPGLGQEAERVAAALAGVVLEVEKLAAGLALEQFHREGVLEPVSGLGSDGDKRSRGQDPDATSRPSAVSIWESSFEKSTGFGW
jgi:hypothetical protein